MTELVIALPDELVPALRRRSEEAGYSDLGSYLAALARADLAAPAAHEPHSHEQVRTKLREALDEVGPVEPMTREDWDSIRREGREQLQLSASGGDGP